jgi:hypothetical protein
MTCRVLACFYSGDAYSDGFTAGKECGIDNCANALKAAYQQLGQCT